MNMTNVDYKKACVEILAILNNMSIENFKKIPKELIEGFEKNKDNNYIFDLDYSKNLKEQKLSPFTIAILNNLYRDYLVSEDIKEQLILKENQRRCELENFKREIYNPDELFKKVDKDKNINIEMLKNNTNTELIQHKETIFTKLKNIIFKILNINKMD